MSKKYFITGGILDDGSKKDLLVSDGKIIGYENPVNSSAEIINASGKIILPGLVDLHTHLREPGKEDSETVLSASRAGSKGGFTALSAMPNTSPVADTAGVVEQVMRLGIEAGLCDVFPIGAVTKNLDGRELSEIGAMADSAAVVRIFSDDGHCVSNPAVMRRALEYVKKFDGVIAQHAQDPDLTINAQMNEGIISSVLGLKGWPAIAEEAIIARDVLLADHVQSRLHVCHVTTAGGVEIIRWAKARGINVTAEVTPHHLLLTDDLATSYDPVYKVNPPLRTEKDIHALREALAEGVIDIVATDHAPHPAENKECEWQEAAFGMLGLETALSIIALTMVETNLLDWKGVAQRFSRTPAQIGRYAHQGGEFKVGEMATLTVIDPAASWRVDRDLVASRSRNTPFHGMELPGVITETFFKGVPTLRNAQLMQKENS
ncbi:MAG: dihydroorotase [Actinobacteria bacterium]|nr:dihydroorotase [Actinomycetota bacterium]